MGKPNVRSANIDAEMMAMTGLRERLVVSTSAVSLAELPANCTHVFMSVDTQPVRMTMDGTTPTATVGHLMVPGEKWSMKRSQAASLKFIRSGGADGFVQATPVAH
ncbi:hypothetical protein N9937_01580 [bacterium]|nr:hypothetical protein [bacterium]